MRTTLLFGLVAVSLCALSLEGQSVPLENNGPVPPPLQGQGRWGSRASLPIARGEIAVAEGGGKIHVLGGYANGFVDPPLNEEYDPATHSWRERASMLSGLNHVAAAITIGNMIYIPGGASLTGGTGLTNDVQTSRYSEKRKIEISPRHQSRGPADDPYSSG